MTLGATLLSRLAMTVALAGLSACSAQPNARDAADAIPLYVGRLAPDLRWVAVDERVRTRPVAGEGGVEALNLQWQDAWNGGVRIESARSLDLRALQGQGSLEFDLRVGDLARGGIHVAVSCGPDCRRKVDLTRAARGLAGRGWQRVSLSLGCFVRDGADFGAITRPFALETAGSGEVSVANVRLVRAARPTLACPDYRTQSVSPEPLAEVWAEGWWMARHEQKQAEIRRLREAGTPPELVFVGDSITQGWEESGRAVWEQHYRAHHAVGLGFGGDRTENVLWRLQHGEIDGIRPKVVVLLIGTNNTGHREEDPATTAAGIRRLLDEIGQRLPAAKVLLLAVFPRDPQPGTRLRRINQRINEIIAGYADQRRVFFLDVGPALTGADGSLSPEVMPDGLHLSEEGYRRWAGAMEPMLAKLMGNP
jgi:lysophospholipase L1-like esterase